MSKIDDQIRELLLRRKRGKAILEEEDRILRAWCYSRVSTEEQVVEGYSLERQRERMIRFCEAKSWDPVLITKDAGRSGTKISTRKGYLKGIKKIDRWDIVVVCWIDRLHRNAKHYQDMMELLEKRGKYVASITESFDTSTAIGRFALDMIQRVAQLEPELTGERVYHVMKGKAEVGEKALGFYPPFGYSYHCVTCGGPCKEELRSKRKDHELELRPESSEATVVRRIFRSFNKGASMTEIARQLKAEGLKGKRGGSWRRKGISYVLTNPVYAGLLRWEDQIYKGDHKALITKQEYLRALRRIMKRRK